MSTLYRVRVGRDEYIGTADEVLGFLVRAEGSPASDPAGYMRAVAAKVQEAFGGVVIDTEDAMSFLESLAKHRVLAVEAFGEPSDAPVDPAEVLRGEPMVVYGPDVDPGDVDLPDDPDAPPAERPADGE